MTKLLVLTPSGEQKVEEVSDSGYYYDESKVLWDERKDGPLDKAIIESGLGGIVRVGKTLQIDPALKAEADIIKEEIEQTKITEETERAAIKARLKAVKGIKDIATAESVIMDLLKHLYLN